MSDAIGTGELRRRLSEVLSRVEMGERMVITSRNRPVAELRPVRSSSSDFDRLIAAGRLSPASRKLDFKPVRLRGSRESGTRSLDYVRGEG